MPEFSTAAVFSSNMVLQRGKNINVFGEGEENALVTVGLDGATASARVKDGRWLAVLPAREAADNLIMTVGCGDERREFTNIAVGEVWLAGGQSNMELELQNCKNGKEVLETDKNPNVRYYYTQKNCHMDEKFFADEKNTGWSEFNSESAKCWSAVGYFFARDLAKRLGVTVGVIGCNWGGTSASYWMSRESLEKDVELKAYLDDYDNAVAGKNEEELTKEYLDYVAYDKAWFEKSQIFYKEHPNGEWDECCAFCGPNKYPGPLCPLNPFHATALYESLFKRVCPYTIKGVIWYQGETDDSRPRAYFKLFKALIQLWRDDFADDSLPFLFVQLPMHRYKADPDWKHWCLIREAQTRVYETVKNTGIAVALDLGEFNEIHPKSKQPVGERLSLQAMYQVYGEKSLEDEAFAPSYGSMLVKDGKIELSFEHAKGGFDINGEAAGFEIAGSDKKFVPAVAELCGEKIYVGAAEVSEPLYVRYLWTNWGDVHFFGKNGIPLAPFRTSRNDE